MSEQWWGGGGGERMEGRERERERERERGREAIVLHHQSLVPQQIITDYSFTAVGPELASLTTLAYSW